MGTRSKRKPSAGAAADAGRTWAALAEWLAAARATLAQIERTAKALAAECRAEPEGPVARALGQWEYYLDDAATEAVALDSTLTAIVLAPPPGALPDPLAALAGEEGGGR